MVTTFQKALAIILAAGFFMMLIGPIASLGTWLAGLVVAFIFVPLIVILAMSLSRDRAAERGKGLLENAGLTPEEWSEPSDPDDFEGEDD
jgi:xanthine/uracil permease